jgi:mannose-6-phosphate isomerase-like protein (cupin superfamily)
MRRVVTGHTTDGKSTVASDTDVDAITAALLPGAEFYTLWGADEVPTFPDNGSKHRAPAYFPPVGGFRFGVFTVPPASDIVSQNIDIEKAFKEVEQKLPGIMDYMEKDSPGMHTTNTIDYEYVISGDVWLELDDGKEVHLRPGDTVIQNGTRHAWRNKSSEPCRMVVCMIGTRRKSAVK